MEVSFPASDGSFEISGTLHLPGGVEATDKVPAVLIVSGSGPIDRDGNARGLGGVKLNTQNKLADFFSTKNSSSFAVLRYDKRGVGKSLKKSDTNLFYRAGMMDLVDDAVQAYELLATHPRVDEQRIVILGHSEGAILLPLISRQITEQKSFSPIKGFIFLGGFGESISEAIKCQNERLLKEAQEETGFKGWVLRKVLTREKIDKQYNEFIEKLEKNPDLDYFSHVCGLVKSPARWLRDHLKLDARAELADQTLCHCLAITGGKDTQVRSEFCTLAAAKALVPKAASIETHIPPDLNHILRSVEGPSKLINMRQDYLRLGKLPFDPKLLLIIGDWCDRVIV